MQTPAMDTKLELIAVLERLEAFFIKHKIMEWAARSTQALQMLKSDVRPRAVIRDYAGKGMGSLGDLVVDQEYNGHDYHGLTYTEVNEQLTSLTTEYFSVASKFKRRFLLF